MTDTTGDAGTQADPASQPQAGTTQDTRQPQAGSADTETGTVDVTQVQRELAEARREAARYRIEAKRFADAQKATEEASLSESERMKRRLTELESEREGWERERRESRVREVVLTTASRLGFTDPSDAYRYLDAGDVELTDDGKVRGAEKALKDILDRKPYLGTPSGTVTRGVQSSTTSASNFNDALRRAAGVIPQ